MSSATAHQIRPERAPAAVTYPSSDGLPLAEDTRQYNFIEKVKGNLDLSLDSFVAADLLWYPVEGRPDISIGPDVLVALGRPKGQRSSYRQWEEEDLAPQVVFEYWSPSNNLAQFARKFSFYEHHGVMEFYVYDEERTYLGGWIRRDGQFVEITDMDGWVSPALGMRFEWRDGALTMYRPDGTRFLSFEEMEQARREAEDRARDAERNARDAERNARDAERRAGDAERQRDEAQRRAAEAEARAAALQRRLEALGLAPDSVD